MGRNNKKRKAIKKEKNKNLTKKISEKKHSSLSEKAIAGFKYAIGNKIAENKIIRKPTY